VTSGEWGSASGGAAVISSFLNHLFVCSLLGDWQEASGEWGVASGGSSCYFKILKSFVRLFFIGGLASGEWGSSCHFKILISFVRLFFIGGLASGEWLVGSG